MIHSYIRLEQEEQSKKSAISDGLRKWRRKKGGSFGSNVDKPATHIYIYIYLIRNRSLTSRELFSSRDDFVPDIFYGEFRVSNTTSVNKGCLTWSNGFHFPSFHLFRVDSRFPCLSSDSFRAISYRQRRGERKKEGERRKERPVNILRKRKTDQVPVVAARR